MVPSTALTDTKPTMTSVSRACSVSHTLTISGCRKAIRQMARYRRISSTDITMAFFPSSIKMVKATANTKKLGIPL